MTARIEAGRLANCDLGKTVTATRSSGDTVSGRLTAVGHTDAYTTLTISGRFATLAPHTLVTITGKEQP